MSSVYSEVTATYSRDRVLEKFDTAKNTLPYTIDEIKISHNDFLVSNVYNDAIDKLYKNWLYLIANAEIFTKTSPTISLTGDGARYIQFDNSLATINVSGDDINPSGTTTLSSTDEIHMIKSPNEEKDLVFLYGDKNSLVFKIDTDFDTNTTTLLLSGNEAEFNKNFKFDNVVSVDNYEDFLFILDKGSSTLYKFDISGLLYKDPAIARTGINDTIHPGRYLVKTVGGKSKTNRKNKLAGPTSLKFYNKELYVLDNGNFSIKVYDENFNFNRDLVDKDLFLPNDGNTPVSITVDRESDISSTGKVFVLSKHGTITTYSVDFKNKQVYNPFGKFSNEFDLNYAEQKNFKKIISSKSNNNILYVITNKQIIKFYKTNLNRPIVFFDIPISTLSDERINSLGVESVSGVDNLLLQTSLSDGPTKFKLYKDSTDNKKLYHENFYNNYYTLKDIEVKPQEIVNSITFNKTTEKIIYNHSALFENINKKIYGKYTNTKTAVVSSVTESTFAQPSSFTINDNFYIGLNEPLITDVINRPLSKLYEQQVDIFNILKEKYLNTSPPADVPELVESTLDVAKFQEIKISTANQTVTAGDEVFYEITRNSTTGTVTAAIYNTEGKNFTSTDIDGFIPESEASLYGGGLLTFSPSVSSIKVSYQTDGTYFSGPEKQFNLILYKPSSKAVIDSDNYLRTTTIKPIGIDYTISLSASNPTTILEGSNVDFAVKRTNANNTFSTSVSTNIFTSNLGATINDDYTVIPSTNTYSGNIDTDYKGMGNSQLSALSVHTQGTIIFPIGISAVFFSISAKPSDGFDYGERFRINLKNPSQGVTLGNTFQTITIIEQVQSFSITVDTSFSTHYASTSVLSGVNIWEVLSGNTTYQGVSNTHAISANVTFSDELTVYSPTSARGAIYFDSGSIDAVQPGSTIDITIPTNTWIVGKGGNGGQGIKYIAGGYDLSTQSGLDSIQVSSIEAGPGKDGGPAISLSGFDYVKINNSGNIYAGAGGGGAGVIPLTSDNAESLWSVGGLNASSGGGGGAGIVPDGSNNSGAGLGGPLYTGAGSFVNAGGDGTQTSGGSGGGISLPSPFTSTQFKVMSGADGGNLGLSGRGSDFPDNSATYDQTTFPTVTDYAFRFDGGRAGSIVTGSTYWSTRDDDINNGTGTFEGE